MKAILKTIPAAILVTFGAWHITASAGLISQVCQVNDVNACESSGATIAPASILTIRGYAFDTATGDRPVDAKGGYVVIRNEDTLVDYRLPLQALEARPDVVASSIDGVLKPENYDVVNAGFVAQVFMASLPAGHYSVQEVNLRMKSSSQGKLNLTDASQRATFNISGGSSALRLVKQDGTSIPLAMGKANSNSIPVTGYPPLRNGNFTIEAALPTIGGETKKSVDFLYRRPEVTVPVSLPLVEEFPGMTSLLSLANPLTNRPLDLTTLPAVVEQVQGNTLSVDGAALAADKPIDINRMGGALGVYQINVNDTEEAEGQQSTRLWLNLPDAPNVKIVSTRWDPAKKVAIDTPVQKIAVKVEDMDVRASLTNPSVETCQILRTMKTDNILGQFAGMDCAIKFTDIPDGMKHSPYFANALRGAVSNVGDNTIKYRVGVTYTNPVTKKTSFYPSKAPESSINITGLEPTPIELNFKNDRLIDAFYTANSPLYPDKNFALVDLAQSRSLGTMNVKSGHRGVKTRVTYPGDEIKEVYTTVLDSGVPMAMKADTPWDSYKVTVESWYEKAPEYKTTKVMDFIGIPIGPVADLEKEFLSHDKADTIIHGRLGIAKGQNLVFDPAAMGTWQVAIVNEKTTQVMSQPVMVGSDGTFEINLGTLTAGVRSIVAKAQMVSTSGQIANNSVTSKVRSLVTAVGNSIEASLAVKNSSGKAPFVQTIVTNFKDPKMQSSVKTVSWEVLGADGTWKPVMRNGQADVEHIGINYIATVEAAGEAQYRAVLVNKYSGASFTTEPIKLSAFDVPSFKVKGPDVVQAKRPVTFEIETEQGFEAQYTWKIVTAGGYQDVGPTDGKTFTFTPIEAKSYSIEVVSRQAGAPTDNGQASVKKTAGVRAVNPLTARAAITGPTLLEAGKPHNFKATINDVVSSNTNKDYVLKGYWVLPDGTRVDGTDLVFTPRPEDKLLSFYTYVDGFPDETAVATFSFSTWAYNWPTSWQIKLQPLVLDVPATVKFTIETPGFRMGDLRGEPLTYTWSLPDGIKQTSGTEAAGTLSITKHGNFQIAVQVSDTRGNAVNITSDEFSILPPATIETDLSIVSKYGDNFFAPGNYYIGVKTLKLPRGDSFLRHEAMINGSKVGEFTGSGNYVAFSEAGNYDVTVRTITKSGAYGEKTLAVKVQGAPNPTCELKLSNTTSGILVTPICMVEAGYIKSYTWTYQLDGREQKSTSKTFLISKQWLTNGTIGAVTLEVEGDLGGKMAQDVIYK